MPWLYYSLNEKHRTWAKKWQQDWQQYLAEVETVQFGENCFVAPEARLFAEPGRPIVIGDGSFVAADCVLHGPITIGEQVSINHHATIDGGSAGVTIGDQSRLAAYTHIYAFNHGVDAERPIFQQKTTSAGITIGQDVWIGAHCGITDGVSIADHAVIGMNSTVTRDVARSICVAGNPAKPIGQRKEL